jgi:hypothetical protein
MFPQSLSLSPGANVLLATSKIQATYVYYGPAFGLFGLFLGFSTRTKSHLMPSLALSRPRTELAACHIVPGLPFQTAGLIALPDVQPMEELIELECLVQHCKIGQWLLARDWCSAVMLSYHNVLIEVAQSHFFFKPIVGYCHIHRQARVSLGRQMLRG